MFGGYLGFIRANNNLLNQQTGESPSYLSSSPKAIKMTQTLDSGLTRTFRLQLGIVTPAHSGMPDKSDVNIYEYIMSPGLIYKLLYSLSGPMAVDIETDGTQAADSNVKIVGIGLATRTKILYFDFLTNSDETNQLVLDFLAQYKDPLIGHNVFFDGTFLLRDTGKWLNWQFDTYGMYRQLSTEGHPGQSYGLKAAQVQLLNWADRGDVELGEWLVRSGYHTDIKKTPQAGYHQGPDFKGEPRYYKPDKSKMWKAPSKILGYYCGLDAASTFLLWNDVFMPSIAGQPWEQEYLDYHKLFIANVELLANQQLTGITIDKDMLTKYSIELAEEIRTDTDNFLNRPEILNFTEILREEKLAELKASEPEQFKKLKLPKEPAQFKKNGEESAAWLKWKARMIDIEETGPEQSKNWENWKERYDTTASNPHLLNLNSNQQLQRLFYDYLKFPVIVTSESGEPSVGTQALPGFGELGKALDKIREKEKELGYVTSCLEHLILGADGYHRLHPQFRAPGTLTCRLAGSGGVNLQQIPKSRRYLECWKPRPGKAWVDCDHTALEQVVMAELSLDSSLNKIYGKDAKPNDIYLFNGSQLPVIGDKIRASGYDPDFPTSESVAKAKKECKAERQISKVITLGSSYGMGAKKLRMSLALQGVPVSEDQAYKMHAAYWKLYSGIKDYEAWLTDQLRDNAGWVLNGIGRPVCCAPDYVKDIVNRVVQSTGHDIHMIYLKICHDLLDAEGIEHDGIVWDFHDQTILECNEQDAERVKYIIGTKAYEILNDKLGGTIPMKGNPQIISNLADAKVEG